MDEDYTEPTGEIYEEAAAPIEEVNEAPQEQSVPLAALQSERAQRQQLQQELEMIRNHIALMQSNQQQTMVDDDGDIITKGDLKKILIDKERKFENQIAEMQIARKYPDYDEVVTKYLPEAIKENPRLKDLLLSSNDYELAYYLAKKTDAYNRDAKKGKKNADAERILKNAANGVNLAGIGSQSPLSHAKNYKNMSDEEFRALANKNLGQY